MPLGKTINIYLMDGTSTGRWRATLSNWNGIAYKIPRNDLKICGELSELNAPGVYFLFGKDDDSGKSFVYVGESDETFNRLLQPHLFEDKGKIYWSEAVVFITPDGTLEKGRVKYLENRFYGIVTEAKRYIVKNGNTPKQSPIPKQIQDLLEEFILNVQLIMPALGHRVFEPLPSAVPVKSDNTEDFLYFSRGSHGHNKGCSATGKLSSEGFWVLKGSCIDPKVADYAPAGIKKAREKYAGLIDANGTLQEDVLFGSPSYASSFVCGKNSNGLLEWKTKGGISLKALNTASQSIPESEPLPVPQAPPAPPKGIFHLSSKQAAATGWRDGDSFVVAKGSACRLSEAKACPPYISALRKQLIADGTIQNGIFQKDTIFPSVSTAAACILGYAVNGRTLWKNAAGKSFKELEESQP